MGKNLKGKELGVGISQSADGKYIGRYTDKLGKRIKRKFSNLEDCKKWLSASKQEKVLNGLGNLENITVDAWFSYWLYNAKKENMKIGSLAGYEQRYRINIAPIIGEMQVSDIKAIHCQGVLNSMANEYTEATIKLTRNVLKLMFDYAVENDIISANPIKKSVKIVDFTDSDDTRVLTIDEQKSFLAAAKNKLYFNQFALVCQTGLRVGELTGLKWQDIDFDKKILKVNRTLSYIKPIGSKNYEWVFGVPKSKAGRRIVPLTDTAVSLLKAQKAETKKVKPLEKDFTDLVFLSKSGSPIPVSHYCSRLKTICNKIDIPVFSMHTLRHTFATRCIEAGMKPKTLQGILGHANLSLTMDLYVHITEEEKVKEIENIQNNLIF